MSETINPVEAIFLEALEKPAEKRQAFLEQRCDPDSSLLRQVTELLDSHEATGSCFVDRQPAWHHSATRDGQLREIGQNVGPYALREKIGEGGMGMVYVAEQQRPIRRKVALKVIKPGMDSEAILGRFEAERNALALMNHPNIARVLDAGSTDQGRPYFVMELVNGIPITAYCDSQKLSIRERLNLFIDICGAIQHAHQKGIIHRDIKPSNVLVTELDGKPIAKVIDFGVAKALNHSLTDYSVYTAFQTVIGTPLYMSPEQASFSAVDVDTRSDVYSLGVLLYELLTGTTPFSNEELKNAAQDEVFRLIRDKEPPRPSNRISSLGETASQISLLRRTQPEHLGRIVQGDLDWIVMKALSKERGRRYRSADDLAEDLGRHLRNIPIEARPPSLSYVAHRFFRRNVAAVATAAVVFVMGLVLAVNAIRSYQRETVLADKYRRHLVDNALTEIMSGNSYDQLLAEAVDAGIPEYQVHLLEGQAALYKGEPTEAMRHLRRATELDPNSLRGNCMLAVALYHGGKLFDGVRQRERAIALPLASDDIQDLLFRAHAGWIENESALADIDRYLQEKPSPIGLIVRADLLAWRAQDTGDYSRIDEALADIEAAKRIFTKPTAYSLAVELWVRIQVLKRGLESGSSAKQAAILEAIIQSDYPNYIWGSHIRSEYWEVLGNVEKSRLAWTSADNWEELAWCQNEVAMKYFRQGDQQLAEAMIDQVKPAIYRLTSAPLLLATKSGRSEAKRIYDETLQSLLKVTGMEYHVLLDVPLLLGEVDEARSLANRLLPRLEKANRSSRWERMNLEVFKFIAGKTTSPEFLARGESDLEKTFTNFYVGLLELSNNRREKAKEHLTVASQSGGTWTAELADGLVRLMNANEEWPYLHNAAKDLP